MTRDEAISFMMSMTSKAAQISGKEIYSTQIVTEHVKGVCIQAVGRHAWRNTKDGRQMGVQVNWFIECKRSSFKKVYKQLQGIAS